MIILGRIRTKDIKRAGAEIRRRYPEKTSTDFETTKNEVKGLNLNISKRVRNRLAGYITRQKIIQARNKA